MTAADRRLRVRLLPPAAAFALFAAAMAALEPAMSPAAPASPEPVASAEGGIVLRDAAVTVPLMPAGGAAALRGRVAALAPGGEIHLVLDAIAVDADPGALYRVELVGDAAAGGAAVPVGTFNVFGVSHAEGATAQRSFVVTGALRKLAAQGGVAVRIVPDAAAAAGAQVRVGRILLVAQ
ncbi:MAG TPA: hypothetical protein VLF18_11295 [Tahibacter sp.]|uniref:hypothetical protein n=1 Tax=Tahibacter sp. TaxID=2056211 RepID=UPI002CF562E0|nr:hypothetical protein [Tahibacter sp.]HSX60774.1 hypothetical protein [Tahibacter sp.]